MALAAVFAANISAQEANEVKQENKNVRHHHGTEQALDEETEHEIRFFCNELYLDKRQAEKFAKTYREYKRDINKVKGKYKKKFAKNLNDRQVEKVLRSYGAHHHCKGKCAKGGGDCGRHNAGEHKRDQKK